MDRSAVPLNFGLEFQANAAIVLMLENIEDLNSIRLERNEDIDIELVDGSYVLAQAKGVVKASTDFTNVRGNVKKAMASLSDGAKKVKAKELVFITNSPNPFNDDESRNLFWGPSVVRYNELPPTAKNIIQGYLSQISEPLDTNLLTIRTIPFEGDDERQRYKVVYKVIQGFLDGIELNESGFWKRLHEVWDGMLDRSGTKADKKITLAKKDVVWPIIVCVTGHGIIKTDTSYCLELDEGEFEEVSNKYAEIIDYCSARYEFVAKVISDFSLSGLKGNDAIKQFINDHWNDYKDYLGIDGMDDYLQASLIKIIMYSILVKRRTIDRIKKVVKL